MTDDDLLRYSRHLLLEDIGIEGQARIAAAHALVIGAGGLGSPVALFLGSAGAGRIMWELRLSQLEERIEELEDRNREIETSTRPSVQPSFTRSPT